LETEEKKKVMLIKGKQFLRKCKDGMGKKTQRVDELNTRVPGSKAKTRQKDINIRGKSRKDDWKKTASFHSVNPQCGDAALGGIVQGRVSNLEREGRCDQKGEIAN